MKKKTRGWGCVERYTCSMRIRSGFENVVYSSSNRCTRSWNSRSSSRWRASEDISHRKEREREKKKQKPKRKQRKKTEKDHTDLSPFQPIPTVLFLGCCCCCCCVDNKNRNDCMDCEHCIDRIHCKHRKHRTFARAFFSVSLLSSFFRFSFLFFVFFFFGFLFWGRNWNRWVRGRALLLLIRLRSLQNRSYEKSMRFLLKSENKIEKPFASYHKK